ncbi:MAG TPA: tetratricopeptide repeat protein [Saprospiraceae bacterium]|nr:tetratricopeptide repeat protein [Saprospiraceae bacterium]HMQ82941.1 tetratricopeptide repeat protein [Saprospiraceae bacterium]
MTRPFFLLFLALGGLFLLLCSRELPETTDQSPFLNVQQDVAYVGMSTCRSCHDNIHASFIHTGMGRSFDHATLEKTGATFGQHALVYDSTSNFYYYPFFRDSLMYVLEFRLENGDTTHQRLEQIHYIVGSGQHTNSHILDINGFIYQAPVTYYTQEKRWDMAPGFRGDNIRFSRLLTAECLTCHNHFPTPVAGSINKFTDMPRGIECERCHGPGALHVREKLAGHLIDTAKFTDFTIVNPRKLPRDLQLDLCQRCHLQGIAVPNEGKTFFDFKPGMALHEVFNVFLPRYTDSHERFIMASQADRLRLSPCFMQSEMTCLTCHNPHVSIEQTSGNQYNQACINCHGGKRETACALTPNERQASQDNCSGCHMPRSGSIDIPHVNITDHYITRPSNKGVAVKAKEAPRFLGLQILTKANASDLEMARAYIAMFDKYLPSPLMLDSAAWYVNRVPEGREKWQTQIHLQFARENYPAIVALAKGHPATDLTEAWTAYRIGEAFAKTGAYDIALTYYQKAVDLLPLHLEFQEKLGTAHLQLQQPDRAIAVLEGVLRENPKQAVAWCNLGYAYILQGQTQQAEQCYDKAIALDPDYVQALLNKAAARLLQQDKAGAKKLAQRVLRLNPEHAMAKAIVGG